MRTRIIGLFGIVIAVSACTSNGNGQDPTTFGDLEDAGDEMAGIVEQLAYTDPAVLPTIGQATFSGVASAQSPAGEFAGELTLLADFDPAQTAITGSIDNILCSDGCTYEGSIAIANGEIDRFADPESEYTFRADLAGDITLPGVATFSVLGEMLGDFSGGDYRYIDGVIEGDITGPPGSAPFEGDFVGVAD